MPRKTTLDPKIVAMLQNIMEDDNTDALETPQEPTKESTAYLQTLYQRLTNGRERALRPGMLAVWKPGLKNRRFPAYGEPVLVVEIFDPPRINPEDEAGLPYFQEPLGLSLGVVRGDDHEFLIYPADLRRFQPYQNPTGDGT